MHRLNQLTWVAWGASENTAYGVLRWRWGRPLRMARKWVTFRFDSETQIL